MSSLLSVRLNDKLLHEMKAKAKALHLTQTDYVRKAVQRMNEETEKAARREQLKRASARVREESMKINAEFSEIEHDPEA